MQMYSQSSYSRMGSDSLVFVGKNAPVHREFVYFYLAASPFIQSCTRSNQVLLGFSVALREPCTTCNLPAFAQRMVLLAKTPRGWLLTLHEGNSPKPEGKNQPIKALVQNWSQGDGGRREEVNDAGAGEREHCMLPFGGPACSCSPLGPPHTPMVGTHLSLIRPLAPASVMLQQGRPPAAYTPALPGHGLLTQRPMSCPDPNLVPVPTEMPGAQGWGCPSSPGCMAPSWGMGQALAARSCPDGPPQGSPTAPGTPGSPDISEPAHLN